MFKSNSGKITSSWRKMEKKWKKNLPSGLLLLFFFWLPQCHSMDAREKSAYTIFKKFCPLITNLNVYRSLLFDIDLTFDLVSRSEIRQKFGRCITSWIIIALNWNFLTRCILTQINFDSLYVIKRNLTLSS